MSSKFQRLAKQIIEDMTGGAVNTASTSFGDGGAREMVYDPNNPTSRDTIAPNDGRNIYDPQGPKTKKGNKKTKVHPFKKIFPPISKRSFPETVFLKGK